MLRFDDADEVRRSGGREKRNWENDCGWKRLTGIKEREGALVMFGSGGRCLDDREKEGVCFWIQLQSEVANKVKVKIN
jgi:hypothetical protein